MTARAWLGRQKGGALDTLRAIVGVVLDWLPVPAPVGIGEEPVSSLGRSKTGHPASQEPAGRPIGRRCDSYHVRFGPSLSDNLREFQPGRSPRRSWWRRFFEPPAGPQRGGKAYW